MDGTLRAGVARVDITPAIGLPLLHPLREGPAAGVEKPLTATALVLSDDQCKVAIVACDLIYLRGAYVKRIRSRISTLLGIPREHVLINCSHTHAVPPMPSQEVPDSTPEPALARYHAWLEEAIPGAALWADRHPQSVRVGAGRGAVRIGVNRRERLPDGTIILGENPSGPVDEEVGVLRFDTATDCPLALVMNYACHPDVLGPRVTLVSPDYVGHARATVETLTGVPALFLQGAAGDIDPIVGIVLEPDGWVEIRRLGLQLGAEAAKVFAGIRTHRRRGERQIHRSMSDGLSMWTYCDVIGSAITAFGVVTRHLTLPLQPLPGSDIAQAEVDNWEQTLHRLKESRGSSADQRLAERHLDWARLQQHAVRSGESQQVEMELQAIRLNDIGIVAIPGEPFIEIGLNIKRRSPLPHTFVLGYSNGCLVYVPTAKAFAEGGYEVNAHKNYMLPSGVTPEWAGVIEESAVEMLAELTAT